MDLARTFYVRSHASIKTTIYEALSYTVILHTHKAVTHEALMLSYFVMTNWVSVGTNVLTVKKKL